MSTSYYKEVMSFEPKHLIRVLPILLVLPLLLFCGCNDNTHPGAIGRQAPDFVIHNGAETVSLAQDRGHIVVLNFWASWCPPCLEEFPSLIALQKELPQIRVIAVSFDTNPQAYDQFLLQNRIVGITTAIDPTGRTNRSFGTTRPPETYIINRKGVIVSKFIGPQNWTSPAMVNYLKAL